MENRTVNRWMCKCGCTYIAHDLPSVCEQCGAIRGANPRELDCEHLELLCSHRLHSKCMRKSYNHSLICPHEQQEDEEITRDEEVFPPDWRQQERDALAFPPGMSLVDYLAGQALAGMDLPLHPDDEWIKRIVDAAYSIAEGAMERRRKNEQG